jgi:hypothetical protein
MASVKFCEHSDVQKVLASFREQPSTWSKAVVAPHIDTASDDFHAALATHFTMPTTTDNTPSRMRRLCALQAAVNCIDWRYSIADENVPDFVDRKQALIDNRLERAKLPPQLDVKAIDLGLTRKAAPTAAEALARGSATDKIPSFDRTPETDIQEPSEDMTGGVLRDTGQSVED